MRDVDDVVHESVINRGASVSPHSVSNVSSDLLEQEKFCKDLYLSLGVHHPSELGENSDEDVASILEQISHLHTCGSIDVSSERNIDDILKEAESLLDAQHNVKEADSQPSELSKGSLLAHCEFSQMTSFSDQESASTKDSCQPSSDSCRSLAKVLNSTYTKQAILPNSDSEFFPSAPEELDQEISKDLKCKSSVLKSSPTNVIGTPIEATYQRIHEQIRKDMDGSLMPLLQGDFPNLKLTMPIPGLETPSVDAPSCFSLEQEFLEERKRCLKLKADLDWLKKQYEREVTELRRHHEGQLLQIREEFSLHDNKDTRILSLEQELKSQEIIIKGYQNENEKICSELKDIKRALLKLMALLKTDSGNSTRVGLS